MDKVISVYKPQGITPGQFIERFRKENPELAQVKIGYAGRLDPLAHGVMLLTVGEENKNRQQYLGLDKTYHFSVLFGVKTDSYDYLGLLDSHEIKSAPEDLEKKINDFIKRNVGKFSQVYPPFSSKPLNGVPLYKLAKLGRILNQELPVKEVEIYKFDLEKIQIIDSFAIKNIILGNLRKIKGHFRQTKTIKLWKEFFERNPDYHFKLARFKVECSSGTYVRSLANRMGEEFGCGAIAFEILRTRAGDFRSETDLLNY